MAEMDMGQENKELETLKQIAEMINGLISAQEAEMQGGEKPAEEAPAEAPAAGGVLKAALMAKAKESAGGGEID
jgi:hypothetical protein